jgi:putative hydrolase of the HAD superfamily
VVTTIFWDIGGVLLTNAWDRAARLRAAAHFGLDGDELQDRHEQVVDDLETGRMLLGAYLERTVFFEPRGFTPGEFRAFMFAQSQEKGGALQLVRELAAEGRYLMAALNNESAELNEYRIDQFDLRTCFSLFFTSCYLGRRQPDAGIYRLALGVTQTAAEHALLVDDRAINLESAGHTGLNTIHFRNVAQLRDDLASMGIELPRTTP